MSSSILRLRILGGALLLWSHPVRCSISAGKEHTKKALQLDAFFMKVTLGHCRLLRSMMLPPASWYLSLFWRHASAPGSSAKLLKGSDRTASLQAPIWHGMLNRQNTKSCSVPG